MEAISTDPNQASVPYSVIAQGYDLIMSHVDYTFWAQYTEKLLAQFHPNPHSVREVGCGTGTFAIALQSLGHYDYTATDLSPHMIEVARLKAADAGVDIQFGVEDFSDFSAEEPHDAIILLYDGLNYLLEEDQVASLFRCCYKALKPGGLLFFDQSTPANSINNEEYFSDEGEMDGFSYIRRSSYDRQTQLHTTTFDIEVDGHAFLEQHIQRAYALDTVKLLLQQAELSIHMAFDGFSAQPASEASERIHWLARRP